MANTACLQRKDMYRINPDDLVIIGIDTDDGSEHPLHDPRIALPLDEAMTKNIAALGVIEPVVVKKDGDRFLVIDGRQRVRHARAANKELVKAGNDPLTVPFIVYRADETSTIGAMVSLNEVRRQDEYQMRAERARRMVEVNGMEVGKVALFFGVHVQTIKQWLAWFDLAPEAQQAVIEGAMTASTASTLAKLPTDEQKKHVEKIVKEHEKTGKQVSRAAVKADTKAAKHNDEETSISVKPKTRTIRKAIELGLLSREEVEIAEWILDGKNNARIRNILKKVNTGEEG